jgi:glucokinase
MSETAESVPPANAESPLFVGIDVGGTNIKVGIVDNNGRRLGNCSLPTEQDRGPADAAGRVGKALSQLVRQNDIERNRLVRAGLATPGPMDISRGLLLMPGNLPDWHDCPIRDLFSTACDLPVTYANDANAAAYGEYWRGAGRDAQSMVLFTLGTGIGGGIIVDDKLVEGTHSCGGELGHIIIDCSDQAPANSLGIRGTLEGYCGAYAVVRRAEEAFSEGRASSVRTRVDNGEELTPKLLAEEAEAGDSLAMEIVMDTARYLAFGLVTAVHAIDPESVVLAGAMTFGGPGHPLGAMFLEKIRAEATPRMIESLRGQVHIDFATLGGEAGYIGAAGLARREHAR